MAIYIDNKKYGIQEAMKHLGISHLIPDVKESQRIFRLTRIDVDRDNGGFRFKKSIGGVPKFSIYSKELGHSVTVRYALSQQAKKDSEPAYAPGYLALEPDEEGQMLVKDSIQFLFWYLHPSHHLSPFHNPNSQSEYKYLNKDELAKAEIEVEEYLHNAMSIIIGQNAWNIFKLRQFAKGIKVAGVDDMTDSQLKNTLKNLAKQNPVVFFNQTQANVSILNGVVQDAIDRNILQLRNLNNFKRWYLGQDELLIVTYGQDEKQVIFDHIAENYQVLYPKIVEKLSGKRVEDTINNTDNKVLFHGGSHLSDTKQPNDAEKTHEQKEVNKKADSLEKVDTDDKFRERIAELLAKKEEGTLHHTQEKWLEENQDAVDYYQDKYAEKV